MLEFCGGFIADGAAHLDRQRAKFQIAAVIGAVLGIVTGHALGKSLLAILIWALIGAIVVSGAFYCYRVLR